MVRAVLAILGIYVCVLGAIVHRQVWRIDAMTVPWGLVAVLAVTALVTCAANEVLRLGGAWFALGWAVGLLALQWSPGGSYLIASDWLGLAFSAGFLGVVVVGMAARPKVKQ